MFAAVLASSDPPTTLGASNYEPYRFTTFVPSGSGDRPGFNARFNFPQATATDAAGNVYIADAGNNMIRKIDPAGLVWTVAGNVVAGSTDGTGTAAQFFFPYGIAVDGDGNLFVADTYNSLIRKITTDGFVSTLAGGPGGAQGTGSQDGQGRAARFNFPEAITVDQQGNLYVVDTGNATLRKINPAGFVTYSGRYARCSRLR